MFIMEVLTGIVYYQYFNHTSNISGMNLFNSLKAILQTDQKPMVLNAEESKELNQAIVELMLEMVKADFVELHAEKKVLSSYLSHSLNLPLEKANQYIEEAEVRINFSISLESQTNVINNYLNKLQKIKLMEQLWKLAIADNQVHLLEEHLFYKAGDLLGIKKAALEQICKNEPAEGIS
ncbi:MAG: TerB family tellurite resistance protein [Xanthomonadales bacterium]|nr:TerB family tellurite resistance protein [Xanthomonadales bacterium]